MRGAFKLQKQYLFENTWTYNTANTVLNPVFELSYFNENRNQTKAMDRNIWNERAIVRRNSFFFSSIIITRNWKNWNVHWKCSTRCKYASARLSVWCVCLFLCRAPEMASVLVHYGQYVQQFVQSPDAWHSDMRELNAIGSLISVLASHSDGNENGIRSHDDARDAEKGKTLLWLCCEHNGPSDKCQFADEKNAHLTANRYQTSQLWWQFNDTLPRIVWTVAIFRMTIRRWRNEWCIARSVSNTIDCETSSTTRWCLRNFTHQHWSVSLISEK